LAYLVLKPGCRQAFGHSHEQAEEVYVVLAGDGRVRLDGETVAIAPLDAIRVAPPVTRGFEAGAEGLTLLVFGPRHAGDGTIIQDFWGA
jgi:quercetin dioxygenase-like cupin family protein